MRLGVISSSFAVYAVVAHGRLHRPNVVRLSDLTSKSIGSPHDSIVKTPHTGVNVVRQNKTSETACGTPVWRPHSPSICPATCPYLRPSDDRFCYFSCVTQAGCDDNNLLLGFADDETMHCSACLVDGCKYCAGTARHCGECDAGYDMIDDQTCLSKQRYFWWGVYAALGAAGLFVVVYAIALFNRPIVNEHRLELALQHRSYTKIRDTAAGHRMYPLRTNLMERFIAGIGIMLHFRWQAAMLGWAVLMLLITGLPALEAAWTGWPSTTSAAVVGPGDPKSFEVCRAESGGLSERVTRIEARFLIITVAVYIVTFVAAIILAIKQRHFFLCEERRLITMNDYA